MCPRHSILMGSWAVKALSKLHTNVRQIALKGDRHGLLERTACSQDCYINNKDITPSTAMSSATTGTWCLGCYTWRCDRQTNACTISGIANNRRLQNLLSNALLTSFVKVKKFVVRVFFLLLFCKLHFLQFLRIFLIFLVVFSITPGFVLFGHNTICFPYLY